MQVQVQVRSQYLLIPKAKTRQLKSRDVVDPFQTWQIKEDTTGLAQASDLDLLRSSSTNNPYHLLMYSPRKIHYK